jgi:hypothetical protein
MNIQEVNNALCYVSDVHKAESLRPVAMHRDPLTIIGHLDKLANDRTPAYEQA